MKHQGTLRLSILLKCKPQLAMGISASAVRSLCSKQSAAVTTSEYKFKFKMSIKISSSFLLISLLIGLSSCGRTAEIQQLQSELNTVKTELSQLKSSSSTSLVHIVYFPLIRQTTRSDISYLIDQIKTLNGIEVVKDLEVGTFQDLGDKRALSQYNVVMQMRFDSQEDYQIYQNHPTHLALREICKAFLNGPPATYDYWTK